MLLSFNTHIKWWLHTFNNKTKNKLIFLIFVGRSEGRKVGTIASPPPRSRCLLTSSHYKICTYMLHYRHGCQPWRSLEAFRPYVLHYRRMGGFLCSHSHSQSLTVGTPFSIMPKIVYPRFQLKFPFFLAPMKPVRQWTTFVIR